MKCLLVSGGYIEDSFAVEYIQKNTFELVIAVDAGMDFFYRTGWRPDVILGDFDSVKGEALAYFRSQSEIEICQLNPVKDDTDTEAGIWEALRRGASQIVILGATGTRLDHVLGNIRLLGIGLERKVPISLVDKHNRIRLIDHPVTIRRDEQFGDYISLIPYTEYVGHLTLRGLKYEVSDFCMGGSNARGVSNEITAEQAEITFTEGILLLMESKD